jgi:hypothetical protein
MLAPALYEDLLEQRTAPGLTAALPIEMYRSLFGKAIFGRI